MLFTSPFVGHNKGMKHSVSKHHQSYDHIDPTWSEGRSYQLVCGLPASTNVVVRSYKLNARKTNRFLPYRLGVSDVAPVFEGDLAWFLDPHTGEWVREAFLGNWWWLKTRNTCASGQPKSETTKQKMSLAAKNKPKSEAHKEKISAAARNRERKACPHCGKVCAPPTLSRWHNNNCKLLT